MLFHSIIYRKNKIQRPKLCIVTSNIAFSIEGSGNCHENRTLFECSLYGFPLKAAKYVKAIYLLMIFPLFWFLSILCWLFCRFVAYFLNERFGFPLKAAKYLKAIYSFDFSLFRHLSTQKSTFVDFILIFCFLSHFASCRISLLVEFYRFPAPFIISFKWVWKETPRNVPTRNENLSKLSSNLQPKEHQQPPL